MHWFPRHGKSMDTFRADVKTRLSTGSNEYEAPADEYPNKLSSPVPEGYVLVFGHTPTINFHDKNPLTIWHGDNANGIDCGSGYSKNKNAYLEQGRLACLRLDDLKEFYSDQALS